MKTNNSGITKLRRVIILLLSIWSLAIHAGEWRLVTFADGRPGGGIRQLSANDDGLDSPGDIFVFDQKLLAQDETTVIGHNAGYCIRTDPGMPDFSGTDHPDLPDNPANNFSQCNWTLVFTETPGYQGSIIVSGREADHGTSVLPIVGGTGDFSEIKGVLYTTPVKQNEGGVLFRQEIVLSHAPGKEKHAHD